MIELTKETFDEQVLQASGKVLVDFYGDGCAPCEALKPHIHKLEEEYGGKLKFTALNTSKAAGRHQSADSGAARHCRL
jgi:thioredoxin 1